MKTILYIILISFALSACSHKQAPEQQVETTTNDNRVSLTPDQAKNAGIATGQLEKKTISSVLKVNGSIDVPPQNIVSISVPLGGYLKETKLLPGMHIAKGEKIAVLEDPLYIELQQEFLTAKAKLTFLESEYTRQKELNQSKASSDKIFQQTTAEYTAQKVLVKSLSEKLRLISINPESLNETTISRSISISSPIEGFVSKVNVNIGKYTKPEDVLFEIVNPEDIHLALTIFEKDINKLFIGQKVIAYTNNNPEKKYPCEIILIGKDFSADRSVSVHCHFQKYDKTLIPGMFMNAEIEVKSANCDVLPSDAIVSFDNKQYVFVMKAENEFEILEIKTGSSENGYTEIIAVNNIDLSKATYVVKGAYALLMKMKNVEK